MTRGIRGATTVVEDKEMQILQHTKDLLQEMIELNNVKSNDVSHVFVSVTKDLQATFPAKALRTLGDEWKFVPIMCMQEIDVPGGLPKCIRVMMVTRTEIRQQDIKHVFHHEAKKLRPDLFERR